MKTAYFYEKQKFSQWWLWLIVIATTLSVVITFSYGFYQQLLMGEPWGTEPISDSGLIAIGLGCIGTVILFDWFFITSALEIKIEKRSLSYKYWPFVHRWKTIYKEGIIKMSLKKNSAIKEYGGYGYRIGFGKGKALIVKGDKGLQLELGSGKVILLGTQRPDALRGALSKAFEKHNIE
ncbi:MAG: hypothetical protein AAFX87_16095 [Bacteroidota bacterium]